MKAGRWRDHTTRPRPGNPQGIRRSRGGQGRAEGHEESRAEPSTLTLVPGFPSR